VASEKISAMPAASGLAGTELVPVVQGGVNKRSTPAAFEAFVERNLAVNNVPYFDGTNMVPLPGATYIGGNSTKFDFLRVGDTLSFQSGLFACDQNGDLTIHSILQSASNWNLTAAGDGNFKTLGINGGNATITSGGDVTAASLSVGGGNITLLNTGVLTALELHAVNGFTGTGAFTNFTIVDGIILAAS
jgi:hypothetical protein